jgi:hypothetical protein
VSLGIVQQGHELQVKATLGMSAKLTRQTQEFGEGDMASLLATGISPSGIEQAVMVGGSGQHADFPAGDHRKERTLLESFRERSSPSEVG